MKRHSIVTVTVFGLLAAGCEMSVPPKIVPVTQGSSQTSTGCPSPVAVSAGDTVYSVSRRCGVSVRELIETNGLQPPYALVPGSTLRMPGAVSEIVVAKGDTLLALARKNHVDFNSFAAANHKSAPYTIRLGEHLRLPGSFAAQPSAPAKTAMVEAQPLPPQQSQVLPQPSPPKPIAADQALPSQALPPPIAVPPAKPPVASAAAAPSPPPPSPPSPPPAQVSAPQVSVVTAKGFIWPVKGDVIISFGPQAAKGQNNDGINIAAPRGTPIQAIEAGSVAYVGNELKGFGNLVLIKHPDGWVSAYAHADQVLVKKGQTISKGQEIGTVGQTGSVTQSQLHFELRHQGEAVDPEEYLPG